MSMRNLIQNDLATLAHDSDYVSDSMRRAALVRVLETLADEIDALRDQLRAQAPTVAAIGRDWTR